MLLGFIFPGQGSQKVGMGVDLTRDYPIARSIFNEADESLGFSISRLCFEGPADALALTANSQPAILTLSIAVLRVLEDVTGLSPDLVAGHSLGEYSALVCAGALRFEDAVRIVHKRGTYMQEAVPVGQGTMAAVMGLDRAGVEALCRDAAEGEVLCPANFNGGGQIVIAGHAAAVERAVRLGDERSALVKILNVSAPFHCPLMEPAATRLAAEFAGVPIGDPGVPVVSNVDAAPNSDGDRVADLLVRQVTSPVLWEDSVRRMVSMGVGQMIEVGCGRVLSSLNRRIDKGLKTGNVENREQIDALKARAEDDLADFVRPISEWRLAGDGSRIDLKGMRIIWPDGTEEKIDEERWILNENGTKIRKFGGMRIVWPDGRLEVLSDDEWEVRRDGAFIRKDRSSVIYRNGETDDFDLEEWEISEDGTMTRKDGLKTIWPDGMVWDFNDPSSHGF